MKIETHELLREFRTFRNGCSFKPVIFKDGIAIKFGCHHLTNLQTGVAKYLQGLIFQANEGELILTNDILVDHPKEVELEVLKLNPTCDHCNGPLYKTIRTRNTEV